MSYQFPQMFDARTVEPSSFAPPVPAGDYQVIVTESEPKQNTKGTGGYLEITLQIVQGEFQNRTLKWFLNIFHTDPQTVQIAYRHLSALSHVTRVFNLTDTRQLHNIPFIAVIAIQTGGMFNDVKAVKDINGNQPGKTAAGPGQPGQPALPYPTQPAPAAMPGYPPQAAPGPGYPPSPQPGYPPQQPQPGYPPNYPPAAPAAPVYPPPQAGYPPTPPAASPVWNGAAPGAPVAPKPPWEK